MVSQAKGKKVRTKITITGKRKERQTERKKLGSKLIKQRRQDERKKEEMCHIHKKDGKKENEEK